MKHKPVLDLPTTGPERILQGLNGVLILTGFGLVAAYYTALPDRIPTHFNQWGKPDNYGSKTGIFVLPVLNLLVATALLLLTRFPHKLNYLIPITPENAESEYRKGRILLLSAGVVVGGLLLFLNWSVIRVGLSESAGLSNWIWLLIPACIGIPLGAIWWMGRKQ